MIQSKENFRFVRAEEKIHLDMSYGLRYHVYCEEKNWLRKEDYPLRLESDSRDAHSVAFLALDPEGAPAGTVRLILDDGVNPLPVGLNFNIGRRSFRRCCEISRLTIPERHRHGNVAIGLIRMLTRYVLENRSSLRHIYVRPA